jgi:hypothetical protein
MSEFVAQKIFCDYKNLQHHRPISGCIFSDRRTRRPAVGDSRRTVGTADVFL